MFIISVIPISNIPRQDVLTYFYKDDISLGALVLAPYSRNKIQCVVVSSTSVRALKGDIKKEIYQLKKIESVIRQSAVPEAIIETLFTYAEDFFVPLSKIFYDIYPKWYWEDTYPTGEEKSEGASGQFFIEGTSKERWIEYQAHIKKSKLTWVCLPTVALVKKYEANVVSENKNVYAFHSKMALSRQKKQLSSILVSDKDSIVITTPFYLGIFFPLADMLIVDHAGSDAYKMSPPHYYDIRTLLARLKNTEQTQIYGDDILPLALTKEHNTELEAPTYTLYTKEKTRHNELFIHPIMEARFEADLEDEKKIILLSLHEDGNQKIVCNDCKTPVVCTTCTSDLTLATQKGVSSFVCKFCAKKTTANRKCASCSSWNLHALGVNTDTIQKYVDKKYRDKNSELIHVKTLADLESGSEADFDAIYIISLDTVMHLPYYTAEEKLYRMLKKIESYGKKISVQTSFPSPNVLNTFKTQSYSDWIASEYQKRKKYRFPPFGVCYSIRAKNKKGILVLNSIERAVAKKGIRHTTTLATLSLYIESTYERPIDLYLRKKATDDITISKEKSFF